MPRGAKTAYVTAMRKSHNKVIPRISTRTATETTTGDGCSHEEKHTFRERPLMMANLTSADERKSIMQR
jgi:hypothetical protein